MQETDGQHVRHILKQYLNICYLFLNNVPDSRTCSPSTHPLDQGAINTHGLSIGWVLEVVVLLIHCLVPCHDDNERRGHSAYLNREAWTAAPPSLGGWLCCKTQTAKCMQLLKYHQEAGCPVGHVTTPSCPTVVVVILMHLLLFRTLC